jgi:hypothetical protein
VALTLEQALGKFELRDRLAINLVAQCLVVIREIMIFRAALDGQGEVKLHALCARPRQAMNVSSPCLCIQTQEVKSWS